MFAVQHVERDNQNLSCGVSTALKQINGKSVLHIGWIDWDSGFRGTALRVGDDILAIDGEQIPEDVDIATAKHLVGQDGEPANWVAKGANSGREATLTIRRKCYPGVGWTTLDVVGKILAERTFLDSEGRRLIGEGGPPRLANDGFPDSWSSWCERRKYVWERQLDGMIWDNHGDNRMALADHVADQDRIAFLGETYPGPFAEAVTKDWEAVRELLEGRRYEVDRAELLFRDDEKKIVAAATAAAKQGWADFCSEREQEIIEIPENLTIGDSDFGSVAGKFLLLPLSAPEQWITDVGLSLVTWRVRGHWVVAKLESDSFSRAWRAQIRFRHNVAPELNDAVAVVGRISGQPRLIHPTGADVAVPALEVEPVAVLIGDDAIAMFADLTTAESEVSFAGEAEVRPLPVPVLPANAEPAQVMETLFDALHARNDKAWYSLFADWQLLDEGGETYFYPYWPYAEMRKDHDWIKSRRTVLEDTAALRVVWTDEPVDITPVGSGGLPKIRRIRIEIDHVGEFGGEYRAYNSVEVNRHWMLGQIDGGPWRILTQQGI